MKKEEMLPFVSVIIPCFNDEAGIRMTLGSLLGQDYPPDRWEVIVVDNNSRDNTFRMAESFIDVLRVLRLEREDRPGSYAARNRGIRVSRGDILAFVDSDMTVRDTWISQGVAAIRKGCDYVGCRVDIYPSRHPGNLWELYNICVGFPIREYMKERGFAGAGNIFVRRAVFESIGLFDPRLKSGGDAEFGNRVRDSGFRLCYDHYNIMSHPAISSLRSCWRKRVRIGKGVMDLCHFYPERYTSAPQLKSILLQFMPVRPSRSTHIGDLSRMQEFGMWIVLNCVKFAFAYGQLVGYLQQKKAD